MKKNIILILLFLLSQMIICNAQDTLRPVAKRNTATKLELDVFIRPIIAFVPLSQFPIATRQLINTINGLPIYSKRLMPLDSAIHWVLM